MQTAPLSSEVAACTTYKVAARRQYLHALISLEWSPPLLEPSVIPSLKFVGADGT